MDEVARYLQERWKRLGEAEAIFSQPWLDLDAAAARGKLDPEGILGDLNGREVLCLAGGGGQQSAAFSLLGARVTVLDLNPGQLHRDRQTGDRYSFDVRLEEGDMRDLSRFSNGAFDIVWQPYSANFVPQFEQVVIEVARVLRPQGIYVFMISNPFASGVGTKDWNGDGYVLRAPYVDGAEYEFDDEEWVYGGTASVPRPWEFRHSLGKVVRTLADSGFILFRLEEAGEKSPGSAGGSWQHLKSVIPPWFTLWARLAEPGGRA